ncbi:hypothetical protein Tco_0417897 [Tanacetum coccineum]
MDSSPFWNTGTTRLESGWENSETVGECVDEIDKLAELNGEMQLKQEDRGCVHASNELHLHVVHVVAGEQ